MPDLQKQEEREYEDTLRVAEFIGRNTYSQHSSLLPGEFRELQNYEVYPRYLKSRRGSQNLGTSNNKNPIQNRIVWDVGDEEYLVYQQGQKIKAYRVNPSDTVKKTILDLDGDTLLLSNSNRADMFLDGDRLFIMHEGGNYIIHWNSTTSLFEGRTLGLDYPFISAITAATDTGVIEGTYVWGVEIIYFPDDLSDVSYSSPNRIKTDGALARLKTLTTSQLPTITIRSTELDAYDWWTHIRLWRTLRLNTDNTDAANPISAAGVPDELFLVAEITKAEMENLGLAAIATGDDKPAGNAYIEAGNTGTALSPTYQITDTCLDDYLDGAVFVDLERIELVPLPAAKIGVSHANRIFVSSVQQTTLNNNKPIDDDSKNDLWYSNYAGTPYSELTSTLQFIPTTRDGQEMIKLISFDKDLIGIKESKTVRLADGLVDLTPEIVDHWIGIKEADYAEYVPGLGICALTNDYNDFAIFGFDNIWRKTFGDLEISRAIREDMKDVVNDATTTISFIYVNGKVFFSTGSSEDVLVLNVESRRGWSKFAYPVESISKLFTFDGGRRAGLVPTNGNFVEIEVEDLDTDISHVYPTADTAVPINLTYDTWMFQSGDGADVIEQQWLSVMAYLSNTMSGAPYVNGLPWPNQSLPLGWTFVGQDGGEDSLADREYRLYIKPQTIGTFKWMPPVGNYIHHRIVTEAPAVIKVHKLRCVIDTDGLSFGGFDPYQLFSEPYGPEWTDTVGTITETGDSGDDTITETGSSGDDTITETGE